jgi:hypothetical protein
MFLAPGGRLVAKMPGFSAKKRPQMPATAKKPCFFREFDGQFGTNFLLFPLN